MNSRRIILMSKLAVYDKKMGRADRRVTRLFRRDYIYLQNMRTRLCAAIVVAVGLAGYWSYRFFATDMDVLALNFEEMLSQAVSILLMTLLFFTVVGTICATAEYQRAQGRLNRYYKLLNLIDRLRARDESEEASDNGANAAGTRGNH